MDRIDLSGRRLGLIDADYLAVETDVEPNREAEQFRELRNELQRIEERLDIAWCGATIARIFRQHPWLQSVDLELWTEATYNDDGGSYMAHYARFRDVVACPGAAVPAELQGGDGALDLDAAGDLLDAEHEDEEFDLCAPFIPQGTADSCTLRLDRGTLEPLLAGSAVSGLAVARLLWPHHEALRVLNLQTHASAVAAAVSAAERP